MGETTEKIRVTMYYFNSGAWRWVLSTSLIDRSFLTMPETMKLDSLIIKDHPDVLVFKHDDLFFKWEKCRKSTFAEQIKVRLCPRAKKEFNALFRLKNAGFAVTDPVGYGVCQNQSVLITREEANAVPVWTYFCDQFEKQCSVPDEFLDIWGGFIGSFIKSGFYFPDFHAGNLLYNESGKRFILLDVGGTRKSFFHAAEKRVMRMIFRQLKDVARFMSQKMIDRVIDAVNRSGCRIDMSSFTEFCKDSVDEFLPRRLKGFDSAASVIRRTDGKMWQINSVEIPADKQIMSKIRKNNFIFSLYGIPHLLVTEYSENAIRYEKTRGGLHKELEPELSRRLRSAGFRAEDFFCCINSANMPVVADKIFFNAE